MQIDCDTYFTTEINFESPFSKRKKIQAPTPSPVILLSSKVELIADNCFVAIKTVTVQGMGSCSGRISRKKYSGDVQFRKKMPDTLKMVAFEIVSV